MPTLFTLGTSDRAKDDFIGLLREHGIGLVVDVRSKNGSRVLHFDESRFQRLSAMLAQAGIRYDAGLHLSLGGLQNGAMTLTNFRRYAQYSATYREALEALKGKVAACDRSTVIICCERNVKQCHRKIIGESLAAEGWTIVHL